MNHTASTKTRKLAAHLFRVFLDLFLKKETKHNLPSVTETEAVKKARLSLSGADCRGLLSGREGRRVPGQEAQVRHKVLGLGVELVLFVPLSARFCFPAGNMSGTPQSVPEQN